MRIAHTFRFLLLLALCPCAAHAQQRAETGRTNLDGAPLPRDTRSAGDWSLMAGVGAINGARVGASWMVAGTAALEASAGYVSIALLEENNTTEHTPGLALSAGGSLYLHPEYEISPNASLLFTATTSMDKAEQTYRRYAITATIGTEYYFARNIFGFLRFGVSVTHVIDPNRTQWQTDPQFDGGFGYAFH
jgi:hypothetical protein